jgi:CBS domain containing-hemolysin-like protein
MPALVELALVFLLVLANAFFVASEFSIVKMRPTRLEHLAAQGHRRARVALHISQRLDQYLSANQLGITIASLALGWVGEDAFARLLLPVFGPGNEGGRHALATGLSFGTITFLHTVVGELAPKSLAIQRTEETALWTAIPLRIFYVMALPVIWVLNNASVVVLRLVGLHRVKEMDSLHSPEELRMVLHHVPMDAGARAVMDRMFDYTSHLARHAMTLRPDVVVLDVERSFESNLATALASQYSRYPVVERTTDRVIGYAHVKDMFAAIARNQPLDLTRIAREPLFVEEDTPLEQVRRDMLRQSAHLAIVRNAQGQFSGIVTLEDVLEEFIGEIRDEHDAGEVAPLVKLGPDAFEVDGRVTLDVIRRDLELPLEPLAGVETIGGYVSTKLAMMPAPGAEVTVGDFRLTVTAVDRHRVVRLRGERIAPPHDSNPPT